MRVLFWSELFWPYVGGAHFFAMSLLLDLRERGYEFIVVTRQDDPDLPREGTFKGFPIYRFPFYKALADGNVNQLMTLRRQIAQLKSGFAPDLVHVNCFGPSILFHLDTSKVHPAPLLVTLHGERYEPIVEQDTLLERTLRAAAWVTGPSKRTVEYARQLVPGFVPRSSHIYNGLEIPVLLPEPLPIEAPRLLCLGRLSIEKGFDIVLTAFAAIVHRFPQARLVIAGDGPTKADLEQQAAALDVRDVVDFMGWIAPEKVPSLVNSATLVVMPSRSEGFPLVALEAALMARPVVAARVGGLAELVLHEETGLLVEPEDSNALSDAIIFLLDHPKAASQMGQAARERARDVFSWERCVHAYEAVYRKLVGE